MRHLMVSSAISLAVCTVLFSCGGHKVPLDPSQSQKATSAGPIQADPNSHNRPQHVEPHELLNTLIIEAPPGVHFSPLDRVELRSTGYEYPDEPSRSWDGNTCVAFRQLTFGWGVYSPELAGQSTLIEADGGPVIAQVRPQRAQIWFEDIIAQKTMQVSIGDHDFAFAFEERLPLSPIPLNECVWIYESCAVGTCDQVTDPDDPETYPRRKQRVLP